MSPIETGLFESEIAYANLHPEIILAQVERLMDKSKIRYLVDYIKEMQKLQMGSPMLHIKQTAMMISERLVQTMLNKYDSSAAQLYMSLMSISSMIGKLPLSSIKYVRLVVDDDRGIR
jgi:hypothetical protein